MAMATAQAEIESFNPRSPAQVKKMLAKFGIKLPDTNEVTLTANKDKHPLISKILELRTVAKFKGTSLDGYRKWLDPNNLIHCSYGIEGAETGRCNCHDPNAQNVPPEARCMMVSRFLGGKLISPDCSALEYREIAHATQDSRLLKIFREGKDIHKMASVFLTGLVEEAITDEIRRENKTINYASCYGCGKDRFYGMLGRVDEKLFYKAKALYPGVNAYKQRMEAQINHSGTITNIFGRVRQFFGDVGYKTYLEAFNWLFQSAGHSILKCMVIEWYKQIVENDALDTVKLAQEGHDSCIMDVHPSCVEDVAKMIKQTDLNSLIEQYLGVQMSVPFLIDVKILNCWK
jgi:DNA polymerase-1